MMTSQLTWATLLLAALAAVACWGPEKEPACDESRPVFGERACCERHRAAGYSAFASVAELEEAHRAKARLSAAAGAASGTPGPYQTRSDYQFGRMN